MNNNIRRFSVFVNCNLPDENICTDELQDHEQLYEDNGFIIFPNTYTEKSGEYIYDEKKVSGYNPTKNKKAEIYPVPVKFRHCIDDETVPYEVTRAFIDKIKENGGTEYLRTFPYGGHEPQLVGEPVTEPCGNRFLNKNGIEIMPAVEEAFIWIRNFS